MQRTLFGDEHELFRKTFRSWVEAKVVPFKDEWEAKNVVPREVWRDAGAQGFLCPTLPQEHGGAGVDFLYSTIVCEELARVRASGVAFALHSDIIVPYILSYGNEAQKKRWLPRCATGECITAIDMTEPGTGSDLAAIRTTAVRDGDHYVVNGTKTFISNGHNCDLAVVAVRTATEPEADPHRSMSLLVIEAGTPGFHKGRLLKKMGLHAQDTAEHVFEDCRVPVANLLGKEGGGFFYLMQKLQQERLIVAIGCQASAEAALDLTIRYCKERKAFGRPIGSFQNSQFKIVDMATEIEIGRHFLDRLIADHTAGKDVLTETCMAKSWHSEMLKRVADQCVQLHGGYGYMMEYEIAKFYLDARVQSIFAGTNEIMRTVVAKRLGF